MTQKEDIKSNRFGHKVADWIIAIIVALIGAYAILIAADKVSNPFDRTKGQTVEIAGTWVGIISSADGDFHTEAVYSVESDCKIGQVCGTYDTPQLGCNGNLIFNGVTGGLYEFVEIKTGGPDFCITNGIDRFTTYSSNQISTSYSSNGVESTGLLTRK